MADGRWASPAIPDPAVDSWAQQRCISRHGLYTLSIFQLDVLASSIFIINSLSSVISHASLSIFASTFFCI
eukprot:COSAG01_NODE_7131_length_3336_cov_957.309546_3_plen_71_part_00